MALVTFAGGIHRISDPAAFTPGLPGPGDQVLIENGTALAVDQLVGPYGLVLVGNENRTASLAAYESTITAPVGNVISLVAGPGSFSVDLVGSNTTTGGIAVNGYPSGAGATINILDATSPDGVTVQQGILTNAGDVEVEDHYSGMRVTGSADAELVNNGGLGGAGGVDIAVPVIGTGSIDVAGYDGGRLVIEKAVAASQTVGLLIGELSLLDPIDFRATIDGFSTTLAGIDLPQQIDAARFVNHTLVLTSGTQLVAELKFADDATISNFLITSSADGTFITSTNDPNGGSNTLLPPPNITVASTGTVPTLPPINLPAPLEKLPSNGSSIVRFTSGAHVASVEKLDGYSIFLEGDAATGAPSVNETSTTFGSGFSLRVYGEGAQARYGNLAAVGYNQNDGTIAANGGLGGGTATLGVNISDVLASDGTVILAGAFNNTGAITAGGFATVNITGTADSKLINSGTITAGGMVFIAPTVTGTGTETVDGSLEFGGYVATGQTINLQAGTLTIDDAKHFFATVTNFNNQDTIVLKNLDVTSVTYNNGALLLDGGAAGTLHFHRPNGVIFNTASFMLGHDGGATIITTPMMT